jgi:hypothetical protein
VSILSLLHIYVSYGSTYIKPTTKYSNTTKHNYTTDYTCVFTVGAYTMCKLEIELKINKRSHGLNCGSGYCVLSAYPKARDSRIPHFLCYLACSTVTPLSPNFHHSHATSRRNPIISHHFPSISVYLHQFLSILGHSF